MLLVTHLILWSPLLRYGNSRTERQSAQMSKISNDGSVQSGTGCLYSCTHKAAVGVKGLIFYKLRKVHSIMPENIDRLTDVPVDLVCESTQNLGCLRRAQHPSTDHRVVPADLAAELLYQLLNCDWWNVTLGSRRDGLRRVQIGVAMTTQPITTYIGTVSRWRSS